MVAAVGLGAGTGVRRTNGTGVAAGGTGVAVVGNWPVAVGVNRTLGAGVGAGVANTANVAAANVDAGKGGAGEAVE